MFLPTEFLLTKKSIDVYTPTPAGWIECVLGDFDTFLLDHANCERKASALAMSFVVRYSDRTLVLGRLIDLAMMRWFALRLMWALPCRSVSERERESCE